MKDIIVIGGPNGAGKTTAARELLPGLLGIREFVNADEIARGLSPFNETGVALLAGRLMIERMRQLVRPARASPSRPPAPAAATPSFCANAAQMGGV